MQYHLSYTQPFITWCNVSKTLKTLGITGPKQRKALKELAEEAEQGNFWLWTDTKLGKRILAPAAGGSRESPLLLPHHPEMFWDSASFFLKGCWLVRLDSYWSFSTWIVENLDFSRLSLWDSLVWTAGVAKVTAGSCIFYFKFFIRHFTLSFSACTDETNMFNPPYKKMACSVLFCALIM